MKGNKLIAAVWILAVAAAAGALFFYNQTRILERAAQGPSQAATLVDKVGKLIALPEGETPVVLSISNLAPLAGNPFFAKAKLGDVVILYTKAKMVYLYDPNANIIVEVASLNIGNK